MNLKKILRKKYVLLSIKPNWSKAIRDKKKKFEYRKQLPSIDPPYLIFLYETSPVKQVTTVLLAKYTLTMKVDELIDATINETPHTTTDIKQYFGERKQGNAIFVTPILKMEKPIPLNQLKEHGIHAPQNFSYLQPEHEILQNTKFSRLKRNILEGE